MLRSLVSAAVVVTLLAAAAYGVVGVGAADDVTLEINVVDQNGQPVSGVGVTVTWEDRDGDPITRTSTADGRVLVDVPDGANVAIDTTDGKYVKNRPLRLFDVEGGQVTLRVSRSSRATFVVEGPDGRVPDASISVREPGGEVTSLQTNDSGLARTGLLELGDYTVRVTAPGYLQSQTTIDITRVEKTETITLQRAAVDATVTVVDDHFDPPRPIANATIRLPDRGTTLTTGADGTATLSVPVNDNHDLRITKDGYDPQRLNLRVGEEPTSRTIAIQRSPALTLDAVNQRVVVGESTVVTVTDEYDQPQEGVTVSVGDEPIGQTDSQGQLRVPIDRAGTVTIEATDGDATATVTVDGVDPDATPTPQGNTTATPPPADNATATATATPGDGGPGFGVGAALLALLVTALLGRRR